MCLAFKKMQNKTVTPQSSIVLIVQIDCFSMTVDLHNEYIFELYAVAALFGIFLETNKHQNLTRLSQPVTNKPQNSLNLGSHFLCHFLVVSVPYDMYHVLSLFLGELFSFICFLDVLFCDLFGQHGMWCVSCAINYCGELYLSLHKLFFHF